MNYGESMSQFQMGNFKDISVADPDPSIIKQK